MREYIFRQLKKNIKENGFRILVEQIMDLMLVISFVLWFMKCIPLFMFIGVVAIYLYYHAYKHIKKIYQQIKQRKEDRNEK